METAPWAAVNLSSHWRWGILRLRACIGAAFALACVLAGPASRPALADPPYSWADPPLLCSVQVSSYCVAQPSGSTEDNASSPIRIDMPTMRVVLNENVAPGVPEGTTGTVTFTITDFGSPLPGYSWLSPVKWPTTGMGMTAIPGKSAEPLEQIDLWQQDYLTHGVLEACQGKRSCTFVTDEDPEGGWYIAGTNLPTGFAGVVGRTAENAPTTSFSAVYVPQPGEDLDPPYVEVATTGSGVTTKAVAQAQDPGGQAMTLLWDFGDGTTQAGSFGQVVSHTYSAPGDFDVTAIATATDGRMHSVSESAKVQPPRPILQAVARNGTDTTGVAAGTLQGWPEGAKATVWYGTAGCPPNPDDEYTPTDGASIDAFATAEGTVSMDFNYLVPEADAFVLEAEAENPAGPYGSTVLTHRVSDCVEMTPGPVHETTAATAIGATEVPVDSAGVPVGNLAVIDAGADDKKQDLAEQREVTGHGSLLVSALDRAHPLGAKVIDAGLPLEPYVLPGPPEDPTLGAFDPQCSDGFDNDGDGLTDFAADPGCDAPGDNAEIDPAPDPGPDPGPTLDLGPGPTLGSSPGLSPAPGPVAEPSNTYSVKGTRVLSKRGVVTLSVEVPGPGKITGKATAKVPAALLAARRKGRKRSITVAAQTLRPKAAGVVKLKLKARKRAKRLLRHKGKLRANVRITYTPTGGTPRTQKRKVTFKLGKRQGRKKR